MIRIFKIILALSLMGIAVTVHATENQKELTTEEKAYIQEKKQVTIGVIDNEPPYSFYSQGRIIGLSIDLLHLLEQKSGLKFNFVLGSWSNVFSSFKKEKLDVIDQISFTEDRSKWLLFTPAYHIKKLVLFMRTGEIPSPFSGLESLKGKRVGIIKDIYYADAIRLKDLVQVHEYDDYISLMKALSFGWIDAVVSSELTGHFIARDNNLTGLGVAGPFKIEGVTEEDYRLGVSQKEPRLHSILAKLLKTVPKATLTALTRKWSQYPYLNKDDSKLFLTDGEKAFIRDHPIVSMGMLADFSPFSFTSQGRQAGYTASLLDIISEKTGIKFSYVVDDWSKVLYLFKTGQLEALANISYTKERTKFTRYTDAYHAIPTVVFVRNEFRDYKDVNSLRGLSVGITADVFYKEALSIAVGPHLREYDNHSAMMKALSFGALDAVVSPLNTGNHYIRKLGLVNLVVAGELDFEGVPAEDLRFGVRPDLAPLDSILNKALKSLSATDWQMLEITWLSPRTGSFSDYMLRFSKKELAYLKKKKKLVLCVLSDRMPFGKVGNDGRYTGIGADLMALLGKKLPIAIIVEKCDSWADLFRLIRQKKCDFCMDVMKTDETQQFMDFTSPYLTVPNVIATSVNAPFIDDVRKFLDRPMGVIRASPIYERLKSAYPRMSLVAVDNDPEGIAKLQRGELFGFIETMTSIGYHLRQEKIVDVKIAGKMPMDWQPCIGTRSDEPLLGAIFQKLIMSVSDQEKSRILDQWLRVKVEQKFDYSPFWKILGVLSVMVLLSLFWIQKVRKLNQKLVEANHALEELSSTDGLTGLFNRRTFDEQFRRMFDICKRTAIHFSVVILDIDHFKSLNDTYGHPAGDKCLKRFGRILMERFQRHSDIVCRIGGEEFAIICMGKDARKIAAYTDDLRGYMQDSHITHGDRKINFTISAGIYLNIPREDTIAEQCFNMADQALYEAKNNGRNRVVVSDATASANIA